MPAGLPLNDDDDLAKRTRSDDFWIKRIFRFFLLGCSLFILVSITLVICYMLYFDQSFRDGVANILKDNAVSVIVCVTAILGVNLRNIKMSKSD